MAIKLHKLPMKFNLVIAGGLITAAAAWTVYTINADPLATPTQKREMTARVHQSFDELESFTHLLDNLEVKNDVTEAINVRATHLERGPDGQWIVEITNDEELVALSVPIIELPNVMLADDRPMKLVQGYDKNLYLTQE